MIPNIIPTPTRQSIFVWQAGALLFMYLALTVAAGIILATPKMPIEILERLFSFLREIVRWVPGAWVWPNFIGAKADFYWPVLMLLAGLFALSGFFSHIARRLAKQRDSDKRIEREEQLRMNVRNGHRIF